MPLFFNEIVNFPKLYNTGKNAIFSLALSACAVYAVRDYDTYPAKKARALQNVEKILDDICEESSATEQGFHCEHQWPAMSTYQWQEIEQITGCDERYFTVQGTYDSSKFWTKNPTQCQHLVEALKICLESYKTLSQ